MQFYISPVYNLNEMAHDATIKLIKEVVEKKLNLEEVMIRSGKKKILILFRFMLIQ